MFIRCSVLMRSWLVGLPSISHDDVFEEMIGDARVAVLRGHLCAEDTAIIVAVSRSFAAMSVALHDYRVIDGVVAVASERQNISVLSLVFDFHFGNRPT